MFKCDFCVSSGKCTEPERYTCILHNYSRFRREPDEAGSRAKLLSAVSRLVPDEDTASRLADALFSEGARI